MIVKMCAQCLEKKGKRGIFFRRGDMKVTCSSCGGANLLLTEVKVEISTDAGVETIIPLTRPTMVDPADLGDKPVHAFDVPVIPVDGIFKNNADEIICNSHLDSFQFEERFTIPLGVRRHGV